MEFVYKHKKVQNKSHFPWFVKPRKMQDIEKDRESKYQKEQKKLSKEGKKRFEESKKRLRENLKNMSCEIRKRRIYAANKDPECDETYEEYLARKERRKMMKQRRKKEKAELKKLEEMEEREAEERQKEDDGSPPKKRKTEKKKSTMMESWPGLYVTSATQDCITLLKLLLEAEYETGQSDANKKAKKLKTKKNKAVNQFKSFLNVLFTANEMAKDNASGTKKTTKEKSKQPDQKDTTADSSKSSTKLSAEEEITPENEPTGTAEEAPLEDNDEA